MIDLVKEIRDLITAPASADDRMVARFQRSMRQERISRLQLEMAETFGRRYGWVLGKRCFTLSQLARRSNGQRTGDGRGYDVCDYSLTAHGFFYREPTRPYRPAAIAAHLYNWPACGPHVEAVCIELGLRYEEIIDFPSWWYPGQTTLLLYTALADQQAPSEDHRSGAREAVQLALWSGDEGLQKMHRRRMTKARLR